MALSTKKKEKTEMSYLDQILGKTAEADTEAKLIDMFVKQASVEGIDLTKVDDASINHAYNEFVTKLAEAETVTSDSLIEKAAAEGASEEMLEKLALSKLSGHALFEGWREGYEEWATKLAQEAGEAGEGGELGETGEAGAAPEMTEEAAQAIVEEAAEEAVEEAAASAPESATAEDLAAAAAELVPAKVEEKTSAYIEELEKQAGPRLTAAKAALGRAYRSPWARGGAAAAGGAGAALGAAALADRKKGKIKKASEIIMDLLKQADDTPAGKGYSGAKNLGEPGRIRRALGAVGRFAKKPAAKYPGLAIAGAGTALGARALLKKKQKKQAALEILGQALSE